MFEFVVNQNLGSDIKVLGIMYYLLLFIVVVVVFQVILKMIFRIDYSRLRGLVKLVEVNKINYFYFCVFIS